jgi:hypothetical protein
LLEFLQAELKYEENFSLKAVIHFGKIVNNMIETKKREEDLVNIMVAAGGIYLYM